MRETKYTKNSIQLTQYEISTRVHKLREGYCKILGLSDINFDAKKELAIVDSEIKVLENTTKPKEILILYTIVPCLSESRANEEIKAITELQKIRYETPVHYNLSEPIPNVEAEDVFRQIKKSAPNVVHFILHGKKDEGLVFKGQGGSENIIPIETVVDWFKKLKKRKVVPECVVFNACHSAEIAREVSKYVDYSVGMNSKILGESAIYFSVGFYKELFNSHKIEDSYEEGVNHIKCNNTISNDGVTQCVVPQIFKGGKLLTFET